MYKKLLLCMIAFCFLCFSSVNADHAKTYNFIEQGNMYTLNNSSEAITVHLGDTIITDLKIEHGHAWYYVQCSRFFDESSRIIDGKHVATFTAVKVGNKFVNLYDAGIIVESPWNCLCNVTVLP
ncbi:MAG: hypothetical protein CfClM3_1547 [Methanobrevibacter sp. CfCl-M3]